MRLVLATVNTVKTDGNQHAFNDGRRKVVPDCSGPEDAKQKLNDTGNHNGEQKILKTQVLYGRRNNRHQTSGRTTHSQRGVAEESDDDNKNDMD